MSRTRILITEVTITKAGQRKNFQIKLPKNAITVIGVANDLLMNARLPSVADTPVSVSIPKYETKVDEEIKVPALAETIKLYSLASSNITQSWLAGKLLLQSLEKANIFYADQIWSLAFDDGIGNVTDDALAWDAFQLPQKAGYKTVSVPAGTTIINGMYKDLIGASVKRDFAYTLKVLLWIETDEMEITLDKK